MLSPRPRRPGLYFRLLADKESFHGDELVDFLRLLNRHLRRMTLLRDRNPIHSKSRLVQEFLAAPPSVVAEDLPGDAPELNPDELVRCRTENGRLSDYAAPDMGTLRPRVEGELECE